MGNLTEKNEGENDRWFCFRSNQKKSRILRKKNIRNSIKVIIGNGNE